MPAAPTQNELEMHTLERLVGKFSVGQTKQEQEALVLEALSQASPAMREREKIEMMKRILGYGIIEDYIRDEACEDIIINALKPIFVFKSKDGRSEEHTSE